MSEKINNIEDYSFDSTISYAESLEVDSILYSDLKIGDVRFSARTSNCLYRSNIFTLNQLLDCTPEFVKNIRNMGEKSVEEIEDYLMNFINNENSIAKKYEPIRLRQIIENHIDEVYDRNFSFLSEDDQKVVGEACEIVGQDLLECCYANPEHVIAIGEALFDFVKKTHGASQRRERLYDLILQIPEERKNNFIYSYINAYTLNEEIREQLYTLCPNKNEDFTSNALIMAISDTQLYLETVKFLKWCQFDIKQEVRAFLEKAYINEKHQLVIQMRAQNHTLEEIGNKLGVTRERVRQLEKKIRMAFEKWQKKHRIIMKISAERNGDTALSPSELEDYFEEYSLDVLFLLRGYKGSTYFYDSEIDMFIIGDDSISGRLDEAIELLPEFFNIKDRESLVDDICSENELPEELFQKKIDEEYEFSGNTYHRSRLSLTIVYANIMNKYYQNGLKVYDADALNGFREKIRLEYGDIHVPDNDRALTSRLCDVGVLAGRGIYRPKKEQYISKELEKKIYQYIMDSDQTLFLTMSLFSEFEDELAEFGVDNRYFLQGILHEKFGDKFIFRRDYISKDRNVTSIYDEVVKFVKSSKFPIAKEEIFRKYPGITDIMIQFATDDTSIINLFGKYIHGKNLNLDKNDRDYLKAILFKFLSGGKQVHCSDIYEFINNENPFVLKKNYILAQYSLFGMLEYLFRNEFQFDRPYIAKKDIKIFNPHEKMKESISGKSIVNIQNIKDFYKKHHYVVYSILDELNSFNDSHFIKDKETLISINKSQVKESDIVEIEDKILSEISETTLIANLRCVHSFKNIDVEWSEWLIYSVLKKWSNKLDVGVTDNQFKLAMPLVAPKGQLKNISEDLHGSSNISILKVDDLDDIDNLISDYITDEILGDF